MKTKWIKKILSVGLTLISVAMVMSVPVSAGNTGDTDFNLKVRTLLNDYTQAREKQDDTGTYVYYKSGTNGLTGGVKFRVMGSSSQNTPSLYAINYTRNGYGTIYPNQERLISQYVYENNKQYAFLSTPKVASGDPTGNAIGEWSPDSVGYYDYCN